MRAKRLPKPVVISAAVALLAGALILIPTVATAAPPLCDGKPATIVGTMGNDELEGTPGDDVIVGLGGDDIIRGKGGNDTICGFNGDDIMHGGPGDDVMLGGYGSDWVSYETATSGVEVNLIQLWAFGENQGLDEFRSVENAIGSSWDDHLEGNLGPNTLIGGPGADLIDGLYRDSNDLRGGDGDDRIL